MLKCSDIMYCFEIDGTLVDNINYKGCSFIRTLRMISGKLCINPNDNDIRWNIVTSRPKCCLPWIKAFCLKNGLSPCEIITSHRRLFCIKSVKERARFKADLFMKILDGKYSVKYTNNDVNHIINVCNDQEENYLINTQRGHYPFMSVNAIDFQNGFFSCVI